MKKILSLFRKKNKATTYTQSTTTSAVGITSAEYYKIYDMLLEAHNAASARQKGGKKPSGRMRGLKEAMDILVSVKPHIMEV